MAQTSDCLTLPVAHVLRPDKLDVSNTHSTGNSIVQRMQVTQTLLRTGAATARHLHRLHTASAMCLPSCTLHSSSCCSSSVPQPSASSSLLRLPRRRQRRRRRLLRLPVPRQWYVHNCLQCLHAQQSHSQSAQVLASGSGSAIR